MRACVHVFVRVCAVGRVCVCACVCSCVRVCAHLSACVCVRACVHPRIVALINLLHLVCMHLEIPHDFDGHNFSLILSMRGALKKNYKI